MNKQNIILKKINISFIIISILTLLSLLGMVLIIKFKLNDFEKISLTYNNHPNINYKVYLKPNNFFTTPYLDMNKTYIASLIDYIDIDFNNRQEFSTPITGNHRYYIKATATANENNSNKNYWEKTYILTEPKIIKLNNISNFNINTNVKIEYKKFSELLKNFRNEYGLSIDGNLKVELILETNGKTELIEKDIKIISSTYIDIPLTEQAIELNFTSNDKSNKGEISETRKIKNNKIKFYYISSTLLFLNFILGSIYIITSFINIYKSRNKYLRELKKILSTYDGVIVNIKNYPKLNKVNLIEVNSFEELIDAQSELRMPINFYEEIKNNRAVFLLINDSIGWIYKLENTNYKVVSNKGKKNEKDNSRN